MRREEGKKKRSLERVDGLHKKGENLPYFSSNREGEELGRNSRIARRLRLNFALSLESGRMALSENRRGGSTEKNRNEKKGLK